MGSTSSAFAPTPALVVIWLSHCTTCAVGAVTKFCTRLGPPDKSLTYKPPFSLNQNNKLNVLRFGRTVDPTSLSGVGGSFTTVYSTAVGILVPAVQFDHKFTTNGWMSLLPNARSSFTVPTTGTYWVSLRPVPYYSGIPFPIKSAEPLEGEVGRSTKSLRQDVSCCLVLCCFSHGERSPQAYLHLVGMLPFMFLT